MDAILVCGGGLNKDGTLPPWVLARVVKAHQMFLQAPEDNKPAILLLSAGTTHKPQPLDAQGFPIFESVAAARHIVGLGVPCSHTFCESTSYDTIGNALFARIQFAELLGWQKICVVTSDFHMPRTKLIFEWVFGAPRASANSRFALSFVGTENDGMDAATVTARVSKEEQSIVGLRQNINQRKTMEEITRWLMTEHGAYATSALVKPRVQNLDSVTAASY